MTSDYETLIRDCELLIKLLKDPQPGLFSWHEAVQRLKTNISLFDLRVKATAFIGAR